MLIFYNSNWFIQFIMTLWVINEKHGSKTDFADILWKKKTLYSTLKTF